MALDRFGRSIDYLRISLTDMCNLRCVYCMPEDMAFRPPEELLQDGEIVRLAGIFAELGMRKIRFTGGEPTLREGLPDLVARIAAIEGIEELAMTTNGVLLRQQAPALAAAGLQRVNISIDSLDPAKFKRLTRWGRLQDVRDGIEAAEAAGLEVKLNAVVVRNFNDVEDAIALADLTRSHGWQVRFIEMMPFAGVTEFQQEFMVTEDELRARFVEALGPLELLNEGKLDGEARLYKFADAPGTIGFISSVSKPFCAGCNRVRLTADGTLRLCLLRDGELDVLGPLRDGLLDEEMRKLIVDAIWEKPWGHALGEDQIARSRTMSEIGG